MHEVFPEKIIPPLTHPAKFKNDMQDLELRKWVVEQVCKTVSGSTEITTQFLEKATKFYYEFVTNKLDEKVKLNNTL